MQNRFQSYLNTATSLIVKYDIKTPFAIYLKNYFAQHKKHGSTDRKNITTLCYSYYRLGKALEKLSVEERIKIGFFICNDEPREFEFLYDKLFLNNWSVELNNRIQFLDTIHPCYLNDVFGLKEKIGGINSKDDFIKSHFVQPDLFLRIRPHKKNIVINKLNEKQVRFVEIGDDCLSLNNATQIKNVVEINKEVVVQDYSSQQTKYLVEIVKNNLEFPIRLWDCCAASGGKTILAKDVINYLQITVSDNRTSIIHNLKKRFIEAGIKNYHAFIADVSKPIEQKGKFNFIICDVPCSGSGTWSRTPEQISAFDSGQIAVYSKLQYQIASNVIQHLEKNGYILYITCSVFKAENEDIVEKLCEQLQLVEKKYFEGYTNKADTMFAALFKKVD